MSANACKFCFVIGASGSGKTTALKLIERMNLPVLRAFYFDSVGVPSPEEMERS